MTTNKKENTPLSSPPSSQSGQSDQNANDRRAITNAPKKRMPTTLRQLGDEAIARMHARTATPDVGIVGTRDDWSYCSPYDEGDEEDRWGALLFDAFATRSASAFGMFMDQLAKLCPSNWDPELQEWRPEKDQLVAAIQIVRAMNPQNEAEACLAAQAVALHISAMKLGEHVGRMSWPEPRTIAILAKTVRAYGSALETLARLKGQPSTRQTIEVHHHEHKHVHFEGRGDENGGQPHATGDRAERNLIERACQPAERPALPSDNSLRNDLPISGSEGAEGMQDARRKGVGRSQG